MCPVFILLREKWNSWLIGMACSHVVNDVRPEAGFSAPISPLLVYFDEVEDGRQENGGDVVVKNEIRAVPMSTWPAPHGYLLKNRLWEFA